MKYKHPLDDITSSHFIYQALRGLLVAALLILIIYTLTPLIMELMHEVFNGLHYWLLVFMDYARTLVQAHSRYELLR